MKLRILSALLITCLVFQSSAQSRRQFLDSLKNDLARVTDDSLTFRLLDELAWTYKRVDADSALMYGQLGIEAANKLQNDQFLAFIYATIGITKTENDMGDYGVSELRKALAINTLLANQDGIASNSNNLGNAYENVGNYDSAISFYSESIRIKMELGSDMSAASSMSNLGLVYMELENTEKALHNFLDALRIVGEESRRARGIFNNLGLAYSKLEKEDTARYFFKKAIANLDLEGNESRIASTYNNLAESFQSDEIYDSALYYALKSFELKQQRGENLGLTYPAIALAKIYNDQGNYTQGKKYAELALNIAKNYNNPERLAEATWFLGNAERGLSNFEQAAALYYDYMILHEELTAERILDAAEDAETKYQSDLKERENLLLKEEAELIQQKIQTRNTVILSIIAIMLLLVAITLLLRKQLRERKRLLIKIEDQSKKLKELDAAKSQFFANISHDLRSPLTLILGSLDKITERDHEVLDNESKEMLDLGIRNGKRLLYLADEIMDLTRLEEGKVTLELQHVKIVPYLRLLTKMFSSAADIKSIALEYKTNCDEETILELDPHQFEKIVYNLLSNAIKFTPEKGSVILSLSCSSTSLEIAVADTGAGIPEESLKLIFDRYYQSKGTPSSQQGVGIGLALVKELIELHQGQISVDSGSDGTTFTVSFPYKESNWVSQAIIPERSLDVITRNSLWLDLHEEKERIQVPSLINNNEEAKNILIVEDHKELRSYLKSILSDNFKVYQAANGASALDLLQTLNIDLILTDLMMPYMDGFELIDHLKQDKELRKIPVMVVSARTDRKEKLDLISKGAEEVISKPFDKEELIARVQNILSRDWDSEQKLGILFTETAQEFEKNIMQKLEKLIIKRIDDPHLSVLDLADEMAASERKVYRMIKKISGLTPYELIKEMRWQYLENHLKNHKVKTATEAAQLIGMSNVSSFAIQYEKRFNQSFKQVLQD